MVKKSQVSYFILNLLALATFVYLINSFKLNPFIGTQKNIWFALCLLGLYTLSGTFLDAKRKSRFKELVLTLNQSLIVAICLLFFTYTHLQNSRLSFAIATIFNIALCHFAVFSIFRLTYLTALKKLLQNATIGFNTVIIGNKQKADTILKEIAAQKKSLGFKILGFYDLEHSTFQEKNSGQTLTHQIPELIKLHQIEEIIIAIETSEHLRLKTLLDELEEHHVTIHIIPDVYDIVSGFVKINYLFSIPLITLHRQFMPFWQRVIKKLFDVVFSTMVLLVLSPLLIIIAIFIKLDSKGPVIFSQERIGKNGKPFVIHKFRTMVLNAEACGPQLSSYNDTRITKFGLFLRRLRLDELPQFYNVLKGEMSVVGPRPERKFYIDQIVKIAPHYHHLHKVLPGITSWGQVKFGYAETIEQMVNRLTFDIIYIQNRSLSLDFKIMIYTIAIILQGRGK